MTDPAPRRARWPRVVVAGALVAVVGGGFSAADASWIAGGSGAAAVQAETVSAGATPGVSVTGRNVAVSWPAVAVGDALVGYTVRRFDVATSTAQTVSSACTGTLTTLTCTENTLPAGNWRYSVQPVVRTWSGAESPLSATATTPPPAPTGVTATAGSAATINLSWTAAPGATSYQVWRGTSDGGPYVSVGTPSSTSFGDSGLTASTAYFYVIKAVFNGAVSTPSTQATATTLASAIYNKSFETGTLASWTSTPASGGSASAVTTVQGFSAHQGSWFGIVTPGAQNVYSHLTQSFHANAGDTISGWSFFSTIDYQPYNDDGAVVLQLGGADVATLFSSSVAAVGDRSSGPWTFWSYTFTAPGNYTLDARVRNIGDGSTTSWIGIDDLSGTVAP